MLKIYSAGEHGGQCVGWCVGKGQREGREDRGRVEKAEGGPRRRKN
jgi:hypothetical protein